MGQDDYTGFGNWTVDDDNSEQDAEARAKSYPEPEPDIEDVDINAPTPQHVDVPKAPPKPKALPETSEEDTEPRRLRKKQPDEKTGKLDRTGPQPVAPKGKQPSRPAKEDGQKADQKRPALSWRGRLVQIINRSLLIMTVLLSFAVLAAAAYRFLWDDNGGGNSDNQEQEQAALPTSTFLPQGEWPPDVIPAENTAPAMIKNTIYAQQERQGYLFQGEAGQTWTISVESIADDSGLYTLDPKMTLYDPAGQVFGTADDISTDNLDAELVIVLPTTGAYRLLVESSAEGSTIGRYLLSLWVN